MTQRIVARSLTEFVFSATIDSIFYRFTNSKKAIGVLFGSALAQMACNIFIRWNEHKISGSKKLSSYIFALLTGNHAQRLLHEAGHARASVIFFEKAKPKMSLDPFGECITHYNTQELTELGKKFGKKRSLCIVASAGPMVSLSVSMIAMAVGKAMKTRFQEPGTFLMAYGKMDFIGHALYALSSLVSKPSPKHDFVILKENGIHPLVAAVPLIAIPLLLEIYES